MPYINVKVGGKLTTEQKQEIATQFSQTLFNIAQKNPKTTYIVFDEVSRDCWAVGDKLLSQS